MLPGKVSQQSVTPGVTVPCLLYGCWQVNHCNVTREVNKKPSLWQLVELHGCTDKLFTHCNAATFFASLDQIRSNKTRLNQSEISRKDVAACAACVTWNTFVVPLLYEILSERQDVARDKKRLWTVRSQQRAQTCNLLLRWQTVLIQQWMVVAFGKKCLR